MLDQYLHLLADQALSLPEAKLVFRKKDSFRTAIIFRKKLATWLLGYLVNSLLYLFQLKSLLKTGDLFLLKDQYFLRLKNLRQ